MKQQTLHRLALVPLPARRHRLHRKRRLDHLDVVPGAEVADVAFRVRRAPLGPGPQPVESPAEAYASCKVDMRRVPGGLSSGDAHMLELKVWGERPCRCQRGLEDYGIGITAGDGDQDRLHHALLWRLKLLR